MSPLSALITELIHLSVLSSLFSFISVFIHLCIHSSQCSFFPLFVLPYVDHLWSSSISAFIHLCVHSYLLRPLCTQALQCPFVQETRYTNFIIFRTRVAPANSYSTNHIICGRPRSPVTSRDYILNARLLSSTSVLFHP